MQNIINNNYEAMKEELVKLFTRYHSEKMDREQSHEVLNAIHELEANNEFIDYLINNGHLIPVSERLPDYDTRVITYDGHFFMASAYIESSCWDDGKPGWSSNNLRYPVTHWMSR